MCNHRLSSLKAENRVKMLKVDGLTQHPRYKKVDNKDVYKLLPERGKIIAETINTKLVLPEKKAALVT